MDLWFNRPRATGLKKPLKRSRKIESHAVSKGNVIEDTVSNQEVVDKIVDIKGFSFSAEMVA